MAGSKKAESKKTEFSWSDDEVQLLLESAKSFKSQCEYEGTDWESKRAKYENIFDIMLERISG